MTAMKEDSNRRPAKEKGASGEGNVSLGIIGDFNPVSETHQATNQAIREAAQALGIKASVSWLPTGSVCSEATQSLLDPFDALWAAPGSPYLSLEGALRGIQFARERNRPFLGT